MKHDSETTLTQREIQILAIMIPGDAYSNLDNTWVRALANLHGVQPERIRQQASRLCQILRRSLDQDVSHET